jgi:hypothetical protein
MSTKMRDSDNDTDDEDDGSDTFDSVACDNEHTDDEVEVESACERERALPISRAKSNDPQAQLTLLRQNCFCSRVGYSEVTLVVFVVFSEDVRGSHAVAVAAFVGAAVGIIVCAKVDAAVGATVAGAPVADVFEIVVAAAAVATDSTIAACCICNFCCRHRFSGVLLLSWWRFWGHMA